MKNLFFVFVLAALVFVLASCELNPDEVRVESISVAPDEVTLHVDDSYTLEVEVLPSDADNKTVSWSSLAPDIVAVSDRGRVTALALGTATVIAITEDGGMTATCEITVKVPDEPKPEPEPNLLARITDAAFLDYCRYAMAYKQQIHVDGETKFYPEWDTDGNGELSPKEAAAVTVIDCSDYHDGEIASLRGIEYFTGLTHLRFDNGRVTSVDLSKNTALRDLSCEGNRFTALDLSKNTALLSLNCGNNKWLTSLDVSGCSALTYLWCGGSYITSLDVSKNSKLEQLSCRDNQLTSIDISGNKELTQFNCDGNPGDGVSKFPVTAWFDGANIPADVLFQTDSWKYSGKTISPVYTVAN